MIIDCLADLHGYYPNLPGGDLLIIAGDLTCKDEYEEYIEFNDWMVKQNYRKKILIAGNHDNLIENTSIIADIFDDCEYLCDSGTEFEGLKIWGTPWTSQFPGINPKCCAFTTQFWLDDYFQQIPKDTDILITHGPPYDILDKTVDGRKVGSKVLLKRVCEVKPKIHVFGHIHESYGTFTLYGNRFNTQFVNCSYVNEKYQPINKPIRLEFFI